MVKARTWFTLFIVSLGTIAATASCGSDEATGGSNAGAGSIITAGNAGTAGAAGHAGSSSTRAGAANGGGSNAGASLFGGECTSDAQCGDGLVCAKANGTLFAGGGPSKGMCTMACSATADCTALEAGADCFNVGTQTTPALYCFEACVQGGTAADAAGKCQGREDFACADLRDPTVTDTPAPFCVPQCVSDAECGSGLYCDKGNVPGLCTKTKPTGDPVGTACDPTGTNTCQGFCIRTTADGVTPVEGVCAEFCSAGSLCMISGTKPGGLCVGPLSMTFGTGDLGYCEPNCACTSDCAFPGDLCRKWTDPQQASDLGAEGLCYPLLQGSVELSCGAGGAGGDGAGGAGGDGTVPSEGGASGSGL